MCELGFFPIFLEKDLLKVDKILGLTFFQARKDFEGFKTAFFHLLSVEFSGRWIVYNSRLFAWGRFVNSAFPNKIYDKQIWKQMFAKILRFKQTRERMLRIH